MRIHGIVRAGIVAAVVWAGAVVWNGRGDIKTLREPLPTSAEIVEAEASHRAAAKVKCEERAREYPIAFPLAQCLERIGDGPRAEAMMAKRFEYYVARESVEEMAIYALGGAATLFALSLAILWVVRGFGRHH